MCAASLDSYRGMVLLSIPLIHDESRTFEIYEALSLPAPLTHPLEGPSLATAMLAEYALEARALAINRKRSKCALPSESELATCLNPYPPPLYCHQFLPSAHLQSILYCRVVPQRLVPNSSNLPNTCSSQFGLTLGDLSVLWCLDHDCQHLTTFRTILSPTIAPISKHCPSPSWHRTLGHTLRGD